MVMDYLENGLGFLDVIRLAGIDEDDKRSSFVIPKEILRFTTA
jgi:hypothetical protein